MPDFDIDKAFHFLLTLMFMAFSYFLERVYSTNKKWLFWIDLFPPTCLIFGYKFWDKVRAACFFFCLFYTLIIILEIVSGIPFSYNTIQVFSYVFIWQYHLYKFILSCLANVFWNV